MKMKAAVLHAAPGKLTIEEVEIADPGPGEVRVKIAASGLCHTDWETMHGYQPQRLPAIIGHEGAGVVDAIGPGVTQVKVGDHVVCSWNPNCGHCFYCDHGQPILCEKAAVANRNGVLFDGSSRMSFKGDPVYYYSLVSSHAEYNIVPEQAAVPARQPAGLDSVGLLDQAQQQVPVRGGDDLVVAGPREQLQELLGGRRLLLLGSGVGEDLGAVEQRAGDPLGRHLGRVAGTAVDARQVAGREGLDEGGVGPGAVGSGDVEEVADLAEDTDAGVDQYVGRDLAGPAPLEGADLDPQLRGHELVDPLDC